MKITDLIISYRTDAASGYSRLRLASRKHYDSLCRRIQIDLGMCEIGEIKARDIILVHQQWTDSGVTMAHSLVGMLRTLSGYGSTVLEDDACARLSGRLHGMKFKMGQPRSVRITAAQVIAVRSVAHDCGLHSLALAQALQFEGMFRQKDVIGEWIPEDEPGKSELHWRGLKWLYGLRWEEIGDGMILRHVTSKRQKKIEMNLMLAPMVVEELHLYAKEQGHREASGPIIISEATAKPYAAPAYRALWRRVARMAGVPDEICSMDTRAGAISEATDAGASLEMVRHAATHSDVAMTARYSRGSTEKIAEVQKRRAAHRKKD